MLNRRLFSQSAAALASAVLMSLPVASMAADEAPDAMIKRLSNEVLETIRSDSTIKSGDVDKIMVLVDRLLMPHVNFRRMTAAAVGPKKGQRAHTGSSIGRVWPLTTRRFAASPPVPSLPELSPLEAPPAA